MIPGLVWRDEGACVGGGDPVVLVQLVELEAGAGYGVTATVRGNKCSCQGY
jgi:hypothetical protein